MATTAHRKSHASKNGMAHTVDGVVHRMTDQASDMAGKKIKQMRKPIRGSMRSTGRR